MTFVTASNVANHLPVEIAVAAGTILEREYCANFPQARRLERERDVRGMLAAMDIDTAVAILRAEEREN